MKITTHKPATVLGFPIDPTIHTLDLNKAEVEILRKAQKIMQDADEKCAEFDPEWAEDLSPLRVDIALAAYTLIDVVEEAGWHIRSDWVNPIRAWA